MDSKQIGLMIESRFSNVKNMSDRKIYGTILHLLCMMFVKFIPKSIYNELDSKERAKPKNYILKVNVNFQLLTKTTSGVLINTIGEK